VHTLLTKTNIHQQKTTADKPRRGNSLPINAAKRQLGWKPQPSGLTRDETREFVLEMIG
jgi:hypothetical protein